MEINISRLGFGLSSIAGSGNFSYQENLVKTAIDCGITHFDVAPYYGSGDAEKILGDILATCNEKITITTKFGLSPFKVGTTGSLLRSIARPLFRKVSSLKRITSAIIGQVHKPQTESFQRGSLLASLDNSINKLGRPIDIFLLHDSTEELAHNSELLEELDKARTSGKTNLTGISGSGYVLENIIKHHPGAYSIAQFENSLTSPVPMLSLLNLGVKVITHRAIQGGLRELRFLIEKRPGFRQVWLREFGIDPTIPDNLAQALIELALVENPTGTVLFSTVQSNRIRNIATAKALPMLGEDGCKKLRNIFNEIYLDKDENINP